MRRLAAAVFGLLALAWASSACAAITSTLIGDFSQSATATASVSVTIGMCTVSCTGQTLHAGDTLVCFAASEAGTFSPTPVITGLTINGVAQTVTNGTNSFEDHTSTGDVWISVVVIFNAPAAAAGQVIQETWNQTNPYRSMGCLDEGGVASVSLDKENSVEHATASTATGPMLPATGAFSQSGEVMLAGGISYLNGGGAYTEDTHFSPLDDQTGGGGFHIASYSPLPSTAAVTYGGVYGTAVESNWMAVALLPASGGGGGSSPCTRMMTGFGAC